MIWSSDCSEPFGPAVSLSACDRRVGVDARVRTIQAPCISVGFLTHERSGSRYIAELDDRQIPPAFQVADDESESRRVGHGRPFALNSGRGATGSVPTHPARHQV